MDLTNIKDTLLSEFANELAVLAGQSTEVIAVAKDYANDSKEVYGTIIESALKGLSPDPAIKAEGISYAEAKIDLVRETEVCAAAFKSVEQIIASDLEMDVKTFAQKAIAIFENLAANLFVSLKG